MYNVASASNVTWHVRDTQLSLIKLEYKTSTHTHTPSRIGIPLLLSSLSSLVVEFVDGGVLSINKQK